MAGNGTPVARAIVLLCDFPAFNHAMIGQSLTNLYKIYRDWLVSSILMLNFSYTRTECLMLRKLTFWDIEDGASYLGHFPLFLCPGSTCSYFRLQLKNHFLQEAFPEISQVLSQFLSTLYLQGQLYYHCHIIVILSYDCIKILIFLKNLDVNNVYLVLYEIRIIKPTPIETDL